MEISTRELVVNYTTSKIYINVTTAEKYLQTLKGHLAGEIYSLAEHAITSAKRFVRIINTRFENKETIELAKRDTELMMYITEAMIQTEATGRSFEFQNDFYKLCAKYNVKL